VVQAALTDPQAAGPPSAPWTLDRLVAYLAERRGLTMRRSRVDELLLAEGLRWRQDAARFGARVDPAFAEERGRSNAATRPLQPAASSPAATRWVRKRRRASRAGSSSA